MKQIKLGLWIALAGILITSGMATAGQNGKGTFTGPQALTAVEVENLTFLREEEKLAHDVYVHLFKVWGQWIFENIAASEQQHMDAVLNLLDKYGIADPAAGKEEGEFSNPDLQALYDSLTLEGSASKLDALQAGVFIEKTDIDDLQEIIDGTDKLDIMKVCGNLMNGSINHLAAFSGEIELMGETD
jgi:hypothetical protein